MSVAFQPYVGWRELGSREEDSWLLCFLQGFLSEFVGITVDQVPLLGLGLGLGLRVRLTGFRVRV